MTDLARSGQAAPAVAGRLERGVRHHRQPRVRADSWRQLVLPPEQKEAYQTYANLESEVGQQEPVWHPVYGQAQ